jgi:hypothetical protein
MREEIGIPESVLRRFELGEAVSGPTLAGDTAAVDHGG